MSFLHTWNIKVFYFVLRLELLYINKHFMSSTIFVEKKDDWIAAVYDNEWYPGVAAEVSWILAYIIDELSCF